MSEANADSNKLGDAGAWFDVKSNPADFIVAAKASAGNAAVQMLASGGVGFVQQLKNFSGIDVEIIDSYSSTSSHQFGMAGLGGLPTDTLLVRMEESKGALLQQQSVEATSPVMIERNLKCVLFPSLQFVPPMPPLPGMFATAVNDTDFDIQVIGVGDTPLAGAVVTVWAGIGRPVITDQNGVASFRLSASEFAGLQALVVDAKSDHWSKVIRSPQLAIGKLNRVRLQSFQEFNPRFRTAPFLSWGVERLGVRAGKELTGAGIKIGVIDSGCDASHPLLQHIKSGLNLNPASNPNQWNDDDSGHGTHCAGVIGAKPYVDLNVGGIAPDADIHIYKVFPDGSFFTIGKAIDEAIRDGVDVLNMSLGSDSSSPFLADRLERAKQAGIACVVAAGNSGREVMFPASLSSVIAVSALGRIDSMPLDSVSAQSLTPNSITHDGYFSPAFTCFGPSIDFTAPGVGIISTVPQSGLKVMDGTSMAAPHIAGLCALYLAHDPVLKSMPKGPSRLELLVTRLRQNCLAIALDAGRVGSGLPAYYVGQEVTSGGWPLLNLGPTFGGLSLRL